MYAIEKLSIRQWAEEDRPREKALLHGMRALSNAELLAILLSTGTRENSALDLAKNILATHHQSLSALSMLPLEILQQTKGIGMAKSITLAAAFELGRRKYAEVPENKVVMSSKDAYALLYPKLEGLVHEEFWVIFLNARNKVLGMERCSKGGINSTVVDIRLVLKSAILCNSNSMILGHNHPAGADKPGSQDIRVTKQMAQAAAMFDIKVSDHIIIYEGGFYSFSDKGDL